MPGEATTSHDNEVAKPGSSHSHFPIRILTRGSGKPTEDTEALGELRRPWRLLKSKIDGRVLMMAKRNYKIYADIGLQKQLLAKKVAVLDTGAGPNCVRESDLPPGYEASMRYGPVPNIGDANNKPIAMKGYIAMLLRVGHFIVKTDFLVCERLAVPLILGRDFCDRFVKAIKRRKNRVELVNGCTVPIVRKPHIRKLYRFHQRKNMGRPRAESHLKSRLRRQ